jgi:naphthalene 1,2-dioxygenase ferredoxin reductase component
MALINVAGWPKPIEAGRLRILEAALDAGVPYPHGCGSGECGSCKSQLIDGEVSCDRHSADALSAKERADGLILACRSRPVTDVTVRWLSTEAVLPMVKLDTKVERLEQVSRDVVLLTLGRRDGQRFDFHAGQFAKLRFGKLPARSYSMASQPGQWPLVFHIRILPDGLVSGPVGRDLRVGDPVEVRGPFGDAYWAGVRSTRLMLLAGGTGMAPILSVLDAALLGGQPTKGIHVYHGVRTEEDLYLKDVLHQRALEHNIRFVPVYSEGKGASVRNGHLHEALARDVSDFADTCIHVAGPPPMVDAVTDLAVNRGASPERIRADAFFPAEPEKRSLWERISAWGNLP